MLTVVPMTRDEKVAMYMKMTKRELAEMLEHANAVMETWGPQTSYTHEGPLPQPNTTITWANS